MTTTQINRWLPWQRFVLAHKNCRPNKGLESWLRESGSLTARLRNELGKIDVSLIDFRADMLNSEAAIYLGSRNRSCGLVRQVVLSHQGALCFRATTYIPQTSLVSDTRRLKHWQNRSLGDFLFRDARLSCSELEFCGFVEQGEWVWGRRRRHYLYNKPIMVSEYFPESSICQ